MNGVYGVCGMYGEEEKFIQGCGNRPLGRNIWEDNITVDLR